MSDISSRTIPIDCWIHYTNIPFSQPWKEKNQEDVRESGGWWRDSCFLRQWTPDCHVTRVAGLTSVPYSVSRPKHVHHGIFTEFLVIVATGQTISASMTELSIELPSNLRFDSLESALAGDTFLDVFYGNDLASGTAQFSDLPLDLPPSYSPPDYSSPSHPLEGVSTSEDDSSSLQRTAVKNERLVVEKFDINSLQEHSRKRCHGVLF